MKFFRVSNRVWHIPSGIPYNILADNGGEFNAEFGSQSEELGSCVWKTAAYAPTQNSKAERRGGAWKVHAKVVMDETSLSLLKESDAEYLCTAVNRTVNTTVDDSGFSPSQWVLGRGLRLP